MSEKCKTCDGTGSVPAEVETAEGPTLCPYIGAPCPDCPPMPEKLIMVRESEWREMREALKMARRALYMAAGDIDPRLKSRDGPILRDAIKVLGAVIGRAAGGDDG